LGILIGEETLGFAIPSPSSKCIVNEVGHVSIVDILVGDRYYYFTFVATNLETINNDEQAIVKNSAKK